VWAVVPVRSFRTAKQRLAAVLSPDDRAALARRMLVTVLTTLRDCRGVDGVIVVTDGDDVVAVAASFGRVVVRDDGGGLARAVAAGLAAVPDGAPALVVLGDLPAVSPRDVELLMAACPARGAAVAPDRHGLGMNALALRPASVLGPPPFGNPDSLDRLRRAAHAAAIPLVCVDRPGLAVDVDVPDDLVFVVA
jgi:2-phospho-L-lactate guanylyltransferase